LGHCEYELVSDDRWTSNLLVVIATRHAVAVRSGAGYSADMTAWQYAQLTVTRHPLWDDARTVLWQGPGQGVGEDYSGSNRTVLELLNRFGADGWELAGVQEHREGGDGSSRWDTSRLTTVYTFKRSNAHITAKSTELRGKVESSGLQQGITGHTAHLEEDNPIGWESAGRATLATFTVYFLRDGEPEDEATVGRDSGFGTGRLLIECRIFHPRSQADIDAIESLSGEYQAPEVTEDRREEIKEAAADYAASRVQDQWDVTWWETPQSFPFSEVVDLLNGSAEWLRGVVERSLTEAVSGTGAEDPIVTVGAGIAARFVTARVTAPLESAARFCEVTGIIIGAITGSHTLVMACAKRLAHDILGERLAEGFKQISDFIGADREHPSYVKQAAEVETRVANNRATVRGRPRLGREPHPTDRPLGGRRSRDSSGPVGEVGQGGWKGADFDWSSPDLRKELRRPEPGRPKVGTDRGSKARGRERRERREPHESIGRQDARTDRGIKSPGRERRERREDIWPTRADDGELGRDSLRHRHEDIGRDDH
jgi:hypothetical protein